jgi:hypothetical protein
MLARSIAARRAADRGVRRRSRTAQGRPAPALGEKEAEIGVRRDELPILVESLPEHDVVARGCEFDVSSVDDVVAGASQFFGEEWGEVLVDQEPSCRLAERELTLPKGLGCVAEGLGGILGFTVGEVGHDL